MNQESCASHFRTGGSDSGSRSDSCPGKGDSIVGLAVGADGEGVERVPAVGTSTCRSIPRSTDWGSFPAAARMGRETSKVLTTVSNNSVGVTNCVLLLVLGTLASGFEYSSGGRRVADCIGVVWSSGSCILALGFGEGSSC